MTLTDKELNAVLDATAEDDYAIARAIESAVLAKIASGQEPVGEHWPTWNQSIEKRRTMNALPPPPVAWRIDPLDRGIKSYESRPVTSLPQKRDIWVKEGWDVEPLYTAEAVERAIEPLRQRIAELESMRRWNIMQDGNDLLICFDQHEKGDKCDYVRFAKTQPPAQLVPLSDEWIAAFEKRGKDLDTHGWTDNDMAAWVTRQVEAALGIKERP